MGEYFAWVNVDKHERIGMGAFGSGFKVMEPCWVGNNDIDVVCTLMEDRWRRRTNRAIRSLSSTLRRGQPAEAILES